MGVATLTPPAQRIGEELVYPDGRHELADDRAIRDSPLYNADLAPVPIKRRTWNTYNYMALWIARAGPVGVLSLFSGHQLFYPRGGVGTLPPAWKRGRGRSCGW